HVETLASPRLEGRLTGTTGEKLAADYLVSELQKVGAKPLPGQKDFRLPFEFTAGAHDGGTTVAVSLTHGPDARGAVGGIVGGVNGQRPTARALSFSDNGDIQDAPVVLAGYGIVVLDSQDFGYDSYATLDVKDKVVLVLRYFPEDADQKTRGIL